MTTRGRNTPTAVEARSSRGFCVAIHGCPLLPEVRLWIVARAAGEGAFTSFATPHKLCAVHAEAMERGAEVVDVGAIARPAEQRMVIEAASGECGWPADAAVTLTVAARSA